MTIVLVLLIVSVAVEGLLLALFFLRKPDHLDVHALMTMLREEAMLGREEAQRLSRMAREEAMAVAKSSSEALLHQLSTQAKDQQRVFEMQNRHTIATIAEVAAQQKSLLDSFAVQLAALTQMNEQKLESVRQTVDAKLAALQEDNGKKLEQMRLTVDEKLHASLERRLGESFKLVSERLDDVHKGLGEMQTLATGVGDLKKVLTNVKTRGTLGEIQLDTLLGQMLSPEQYGRNVALRPDNAERVDFAVALPGQGDGSTPVWLPIDAKFPLEDYQRLLDAQDQGDVAAASEAARQLEARIRQEAKSIQDKYLHPPITTDFAILFLPIEGLFAEMLRRSGLWETLQREYRVVITGPTTITALLNSLQMGFRTLNIQKRSSEVWQLLGTVKTEFGKFGDVLEKTRKKLQEASHTMDDAAVRSRAIERRLRTVEALPAGGDGQQMGEEATSV